MRLVINLIAVVALAAPVGLRAQAADDSPACRATLDGDLLTTAIQFPDGYVVEGPWRIIQNRPAAMQDGRNGMAAAAVLDRIVEVAPGTGERVTTPFPDPIETTFEGHTEEELVYRAAQIWCLTVLKAQQHQQDTQSQDAGPVVPKGAPARGAGT